MIAAATTHSPMLGCSATAASPPKPKVAYLTSWFPVLTETFILYEMLATEQQGVNVQLYPLRRQRASVVHPEARSWTARARFQPLLSLPVLSANLAFLLRRPRNYLGTLFTLLRATLGSSRYFFGALVMFPKAVCFAKSMQANGVTHVHAHFASHPAAAAFVIHRLTGIPYSFTAHGSDLHRDRHMLREKVAEAATVVTISDYNKQVIIDHCGRRFADKVLVIHCGVDTDKFRPPSRGRRLKQRTDPLTIVCTGKLHEVKGQSFLIDACRLLRRRGIRVNCHFVGAGPDRDALIDQAAKAGLANRMHFHGWCRREEVIGLLQRADVAVAPSVATRDGRREGIPVALMEAMASGLPVVASRLSGIPELVEDRQSGLLVPPGDTEALADALEELHSDPALSSRLARAAREKVANEFNLLSNAATLARFFHSGDRP